MIGLMCSEYAEASGPSRPALSQVYSPFSCYLVTQETVFHAHTEDTAAL